MKQLFSLIALTLSLALSAHGASLRLHRLIQDHVVFQRGKPINIEGEAAPAAQVQVAFDGVTASSVADRSGHWKLNLPQHPAGGPFVLQVVSGAESLTVSDILIGDVWIASGQSNMEYKMSKGVSGGPSELTMASYPQIRYFEVGHRPSGEPQQDLSTGEWSVCTPDSIGHFSAVAFYFARKVYAQTGIPIGLVDSSWGGSSIEAWMPQQALAGLPHAPGPQIPADEMKDMSLESFYALNEGNIQKMQTVIDSSFEGLKTGVISPDFDDSKWSKIELPAWGESSRQIYWLRRSFEWKATSNGKVELSLGFPCTMFNIYLNGTEVFKATGGACKFTVDPKDLRAGRNVLVMRLANHWWFPYFEGAAEDFRITETDGAQRVSLAGTWSFSKTVEPKLPSYYGMQELPSALYNGMIAPLVDFGIAGVLWYQGEANGDRGAEYRWLFPSMIQDWRIRFRQGYTPFFFVQLANWGNATELAEPNGWPFLREAQDHTLFVPLTGMAVAIDVGEARDIHPKNKLAVGERLARHALKHVYGQESLETDGPRYRSLAIDAGKVTLQFDHAKGLRTRDGGAPKSFTVAGNDHVFHRAEARIDGDKIVLESAEVPEPLSVRYAWARNPPVNLENDEGLPAAPFRTDVWE